MPELQTLEHHQTCLRVGRRVNVSADPRVIVSLDYPDAGQAMDFVSYLDPGLCRLKIGMELFTRAGPALVRKFIADGFDIFLDLKFHDIPTTVANACAAAADMGVWMVNVHASGGKLMLEEARESVIKMPQQPLLVAVTVLTSMDESDLQQTGTQGTVKDQVLRLATLASDCGLDGVVCSAQEAGLLKETFGPSFRLVTPGIRPGGAQQDDQRRIMTPAKAILAGSHYLVIGRPITQSEDPLAALLAINREIENAIQSQ